jgi:DNA-binding MarR family transcriptional regulator
MREVHEAWRKLDVPLAQLKSLFIISSRGSTSVRGLAKDLGVTPANVTGIIDRLVTQGLVTRTESAQDRRSVRLQLTERGRAKIAAIHQTHLHKLPQMLKDLSPADLGCLVTGLRALVTAFERERMGTDAVNPVQEPDAPAAPALRKNRSAKPGC